MRGEKWTQVARETLSFRTYAMTLYQDLRNDAMRSCVSPDNRKIQKN